MARKRSCGLFDYFCSRRVDVEIPIYVNWGDLPGPTRNTFAGASAGLSLGGEALINFQPAVTVVANMRGSTLEKAVVRLDGAISFRTEARLEATANGTFTYNQPLLDKRFVKILLAGSVPIVINGRLQLTAQFRAQADAALDISQVMELGYDLTAGLEYQNGNWQVLSEATPWQRYELRGEADTRAFVEVRFVPDLTVKFFDVASGRLLVEPYLYGEAALEGHFVYQDATGGAGSDTDYRFTKMEFGGGIDGKLRLGLAVFDMNLAGYPSRDPNELYLFKVLERTPIIGLPALAPSTQGSLRIGGKCAIGLKAKATPVPNPFKLLGVGPDTWNPFVDDSASWQVIMPSGSVELTLATPPGDAWFSADTAGQYTLRFSGHSAWGSFIRQYQDLQVAYDPSQVDCPGAGTPWITPATGSWTRTPQTLAITSDGADILYYRLTSTADGSSPADPTPPGPQDHDGWLTGPETSLALSGTPGQLRRFKVRFVGCTAGACGPDSGIHEYAIDLRGGGAITVTPATGTWTTTPQGLSISSSGADRIYYLSTSSLDGSTPADPGVPGPTLYDGVLNGPEASFVLYGSPGKLKRAKLRFAGCSGTTCGPASAVYAYTIDLRTGSIGGPTYPLNDTGLDWCANASQNNLACPVSGFPGQDAESGRDVTHHDDSDGQAGFSFTKIANSGNALPAAAALGSGANDWACTRDNVTGLTWEVKTNDGGLRDQDWTYS
ncbi:MAG: hypothetical protein KAX46_05010, partial [Chromatiaceae bacterium]|nr:hypothetical protein [Chromatiaceae bacterium]